MRLRSFEVTNYRTIDDSGLVVVDPNVTCLMGKNESGKSAVMQVLWKFNNVAGAKFDLLTDLPAERFVELRKEDPEVVVLQFFLEEADKIAFSESFGPVVATPEAVTIRGTFSGKRSAEIPLVYSPPAYSTIQGAIDSAMALCRETAAGGDESRKETAVAVMEVLERLATESGSAQSSSDIAADVIAASIDALRSLGADAKSSLQALEDFRDKRRVPNATMGEQIRKWVLDRLPTFIYFEDYGRLRTRLNLSAYLGRNRTPPSGEDGALHRTQQALFEWTKLDPEELHMLGLPTKSDETQEQVERRKAERSRLLESASYRASGAWIEWWDPRTNIHTLVIEADGDDLELRVSDDINPWKIPFGDRARGFQWFFSFYLTFLIESAKAHRGAILLLDEPGLHLHLTQQLKLLAFFQRVAKDNQIIYSSHSPFMVDPDRPDNVRTVYLRPKNPDDPKSRANTRVSGGIEPEGDRETLLPMQAAGAYQLAQAIFLGKRTLIVEGISDYWLLRSLSVWQREKGARYLNDDTVLVWAGGMTYMMPLASIMASREQMGPNRMAVLLDSDEAGLNKAKALVRLLTAEGGSVLLVGDILKIEGAEIEDLVEPGELVAALRAAGKTFATTRTRQPGETNVPFLRRVFAENNWGELTVQDKARIVLALVDSWRSRAASPQPATLARASDVFTAINNCFDRLFADSR
jgi:AAA ATPase domain